MVEYGVFFIYMYLGFLSKEGQEPTYQVVSM